MYSKAERRKQISLPLKSFQRESIEELSKVLKNEFKNILNGTQWIISLQPKEGNSNIATMWVNL